MTASDLAGAAAAAAASDGTPTPPEGQLPGLDLVAHRPLIGGPIEVLFRLAPGDRSLVVGGDAIVAGSAIAERLRDPRVAELPSAATPVPAPWCWPWSGGSPPPRIRSRRRAASIRTTLA